LGDGQDMAPQYLLIATFALLGLPCSFAPEPAVAALWHLRANGPRNLNRGSASALSP